MHKYIVKLLIFVEHRLGLDEVDQLITESTDDNAVRRFIRQVKRFSMSKVLKSFVLMIEQLLLVRQAIHIHLHSAEEGGLVVMEVCRIAIVRRAHGVA